MSREGECPREKQYLLRIRVETNEQMIPICMSWRLSKILSSIYTYLELDEKLYRVEVYNGDQRLVDNQLEPYLDKTLDELVTEYGWNIHKLRIHLSRTAPVEKTEASETKPDSGGRKGTGNKPPIFLGPPGFVTFIVLSLVFIFASATAAYFSYQAYEFPAFYLPVMVGFIVGVAVSILGNSVTRGFTMGFLAGIVVSLALIAATS